MHRRLAKSAETNELLRQQASVFEWMNKNEAEKDSPPVWFLNYMETYREEMAAEITTKVSLVQILEVSMILSNSSVQLVSNDEA